PGPGPAGDVAPALEAVRAGAVGVAGLRAAPLVVGGGAHAAEAVDVVLAAVAEAAEAVALGDAQPLPAGQALGAGVAPGARLLLAGGAVDVDPVEADVVGFVGGANRHHELAEGGLVGDHELPGRGGAGGQKLAVDDQLGADHGVGVADVGGHPGAGGDDVAGARLLEGHRRRHRVL